MKGKTPWNKGIELSEEARKKMSEAKLANPRINYSHSEETKLKIANTKRKNRDAN
jgi:hypothetical protein